MPDAGQSRATGARGRLEPQGREGDSVGMEARPAALARAGGDGARKQPHAPAPAPPALSPKDTRYSAQSRASNQKKENCIWRHPFVISDKGFNTFSLSNVRLTGTEKEYQNAGWHVAYCFDIDDIIRKFESFAHTELNLETYKDKDYY